MKLCLGAGKRPMEGYVNLDMVALPGIDAVFNLEECATKRLPFDDDTFDELYASHVLEHITNILPLMQELHRVTKPGGQFLARVPYGSSDDAFENPTHIRYFFLNSFQYFAQPIYHREDYGYRGDWKSTIRLLIYPKVYDCYGGDKDKLIASINCERNVVAEMQAYLTAVKPIRPMDKSLQDDLMVDLLRNA